MTKVLETERLILRYWEASDLERLFEIGNDADVMFRIGDGKPYENIEQAEKILNWIISYQKARQKRPSNKLERLVFQYVGKFF